MLEELRTGAELGDVRNQKWLADLYRDGKYVERDPKQEVKWTAEAAQQGDMIMQRRMAEYILGEYGGLKKDEATALRLYQMAAKLGDTPSRIVVIEAYLHGRLGLEPDRARGLRMLKEWADIGSAEAQFRLGRIYQEGNFLPRDPDRAMELFKAAATQDHAGAKAMLGAAAATAPARQGR